MSKTMLKTRGIQLVIFIWMIALAVNNLAAEEKPIVLGYVGNIASPGTKPCMEIQKMAVEEINAAGGILGRPVKYIIEDNKSDTSLTVTGATRMIMSHRALVFWVEGRSEINLANRANSAKLFPEYPHIVICNGAVAPGITQGILNEYEKYKFMFRDVDWACVPWYYKHPWDIMKNIIGAKKIAMLWEDLMWTKPYREGGILKGLPSQKEFVEKHWGLKVVYDKPIKYRVGMYLPILESIKQAGADAIYYMTSWFSDDEVFVKQWSQSSAQDLPIVTGAGSVAFHNFDAMASGKSAGAIGWCFDSELPITPMTIPFVKKAKQRNIPLDLNAHDAYNGVYLVKKAIEKAGTADDVNAIIKALEEVEIEGTLWNFSFRAPKEDIWFHGFTMSDINNFPPLEMRPGVNFPWAQWQKGGKREVIYNSAKVPWADAKKYKSPAELRR